MAKTEVKAELTLQDLASAQLAKLKTGFESLNAGVNRVQASMTQFARETAAVAIGVNMGSIVQGLKGIGTGAYEEAKEGQRQMRELQKTVAGLSAKAGGVDDFTKGADKAYEALARISREAKVARGDLVEAFKETGANTTKTSDELTALIENVAKASRALSVPVKDVVAGFAEIEKNTISASNPLIDMVKQANIFRGHNEQIALKMQSMGRQGMLTIANKALKEMQERAKKMPPTIDDLAQSFRDMKTDVMRIVGNPMVAAVTPVFDRLHKKIMDNRGAIEKYAHMVGVKAGEWITEGAKKFEQAFGYIKTHSDEIKQAIIEGFTFAKKVFDFILEHKGAVAAGIVAAKVGPGGVGAAVDTAKSIGSFAEQLSKLNAMGIGPLTSGSAGAAASLGAFALATAGVTAAVISFQNYLKETGGFLNPASGEKNRELDAQMGYFKRVAGDFNSFGDGAIREFDRIREAALRNADALGQNRAQIAYQIDALWQQHRALAEASKGMVEARDIAKAMPDPESWGKLTSDAFAQVAAQEYDAAKAFTDSFNAAAKANNQAAMNAAIQIVAGSKTLQQSLLDSGTSVGLSLEKFADLIGDKAGDFADRLRARAGEEKAATNKKPDPALMQFNGGQTFNIKQDFRDQDPDRVVIAFRQDIARAAEQRTQARTALPFGGLAELLLAVVGRDGDRDQLLQTGELFVLGRQAQDEVDIEREQVLVDEGASALGDQVVAVGHVGSPMARAQVARAITRGVASWHHLPEGALRRPWTPRSSSSDRPTCSLPSWPKTPTSSSSIRRRWIPTSSLRSTRPPVAP